MTATPNRAQELAVRLRSDQARQNGISQREMEECAAALDRLARFESAALSVPDIEDRAARDDRRVIVNDLDISQLRVFVQALRDDRATLLDALRAVTEERDVASKLADINLERAEKANHFLEEATARLAQAQEEIASWKEVNGRNCAEALKVKERLTEALADAEECRKDRDLAIKSLEKRTAELLQAQKEIERLTAARDARVQDLANADERERVLRLEVEKLRGMLAALQRAGMESRDEMRDRIIGLTGKLSQAERDKAQMREGLREVRALVYGIYSHYSREEVARSSGGSQLHLYAQALQRLDALDAIVPPANDPATAQQPLEGGAEMGRESKPELRAGPPPEALRKAWPEWLFEDGDPIRFIEDGTRYRLSTYRAEESRHVDEGAWELPHWRLKPRGKTWAEVEALAAHRDAKTGNVILGVEPHTKRLSWGDGEVDCIRVTVGAKPEKPEGA